MHQSYKYITIKWGELKHQQELFLGFTVSDYQCPSRKHATNMHHNSSFTYLQRNTVTNWNANKFTLPLSAAYIYWINVFQRFIWGWYPKWTLWLLLSKQCHKLVHGRSNTFTSFTRHDGFAMTVLFFHVYILQCITNVTSDCWKCKLYLKFCYDSSLLPCVYLTVHYKCDKWLLEVQTVPEVFGISGPLPAAVSFADSAVALPADDPCLLELTIKVISTVNIVIMISDSSSCYRMIRALGAYKDLQMRTVITFKYAHMHACTHTEVF